MKSSGGSEFFGGGGLGGWPSGNVAMASRGLMNLTIRGGFFTWTPPLSVRKIIF
jgi:hypothetical protein